MTASFNVNSIETLPPPRAQRLLAKPTLRRLSEIAVVGVLGRLPRRIRRAAARRYANAAWRELNGLAPLDQRANKQLVQWVAREFQQLGKGGQSGKAVDGATSSANDVGSAASGPAERSPEVSISHVTEDEGPGEL